MDKSFEVVPLVISVTGHRDILSPSVSVIKAKVNSILNYVIKNNPSTSIMVYTALADGADRIVAHAVLEMKKESVHKDLSIRLITPLPFELDDYKRDFSESSKQEFDHLLALVDEYYVIDPYLYLGADGKQVTQADISPEAIAVEELYTTARNAQYANLGAFLVKNCNILIALWDGVYLPDSPGGTSNVIRLMIEGNMDWGREGSFMVPPNPNIKQVPKFEDDSDNGIFHIHVERSARHIEAPRQLLGRQDRQISCRQRSVIAGVDFYSINNYGDNDA